LERVKGIEPSPPAWKAGALPLSYTRAPAAGPGDRRRRILAFRSDRASQPETEANRAEANRNWWAEQDSNLRRLSHQIYSLARLAASVSARLARAIPFSGRTSPVLDGRLRDVAAQATRVEHPTAWS